MRSSWCLNRHFAWLWFGQSISQLGDAIIEITFPLWITLLTHAPLQVALVVATEVLPPLCLAPLTGMLADRWNPRTTMIVCDLVRGGLVGSLLLVPPAIIGWYIYVVSLSVALVGSFFSPAKQVVLRLVIAEEEIVRAQALSRAAQSITLLLGPALGSLLIFCFGVQIGVLLDALSFGVGAVALLPVKVLYQPSRSRSAFLGQPWRVLWTEVRDGFRSVLQDRVLVLLVTINSVAALVGHLWYAVDVFFVKSSLKAPAASVGLLWAISGAGGLLGSVLILLFANQRQQKGILLIGFLLSGISLVWYATLTSYTWAVAAAFLAGLGDDPGVVALGGLVMARAKPGVLGRVTAFMDATSAFTTLLALLVVGMLQAWLAPWQLLLLCGLALCLVSLGAVFWLREKNGAPEKPGETALFSNDIQT